MQQFGYKDLAKYYDKIYSSKDYPKESEFIKQLLEKETCKSLLDVGCGTGTHMAILEQSGYECTGVDMNDEMLSVARRKVKGDLYTANMREFNLGKKFDAVICMYAAFNHLLSMEDAVATMRCMREHMTSGLVLIDLHNPKADGNRKDNIEGIERVMEWSFDKATHIETTYVKFNIEGKLYDDCHKMRIYSIDEMRELLVSQGFSGFAAYSNCTREPADSSSKNIEIFARL